MSRAITYASIIEQCRSDPSRYVAIERDGAVARLRLEDPKRLNALTPSLTWQLHQALATLIEAGETKVVVLTGADPAFSAGGDLGFIHSAQQAIREGPEGTLTVWQWIRRQFGGIARLLAQSDVYCVAAVNGPAAGVGMSFAFACDYLLGSERAVFAPAFGRIGLVPEVGSSWHLCRRLGYQRAMALFVEGRRLAAAEALELGLLNRVVPHNDLMTAADDWAQQVCALPAGVVAMAKAQLRKAADMSWEQAITMEEFAEPNCFSSEGHRHAVEALLGGAPTDSGKTT